jgi:hypothetical protein
MTDIALVSLQGAHEFLVAARDPALCPLVVGGQPAQDPLLQLGEASRRHRHPLIRSGSL